MYAHNRFRNSLGARGTGPAAQRGLSLIAMSIVLGLIALATFGLGLERVRLANENAGKAIGYSLNQVSQGVVSYRTTNYAALTAATPVVTGFTNPQAPTVAELKAAGFINSAIANALPDGTTYNILFAKDPVGCVNPAPAGSTCNTYSRLWLSNPILDSDTGRPHITRLKSVVAAVSETAGYSYFPTAATITGGNGAWTLPNPDATQRAGILMVVSGLGGDPFPYLRVGDTRDPLFQNQVTGNQFITPFKVAGTACTPQGAFAVADYGMLFCNQGIWRQYVGPAVTGGTGCALDGAMGVTTAGASLICVAGVWRDHLTYGTRGTGYYAHGAVVPQPSCGSGLTPSAVIAAVSASVIIGATNPGNNTGSFQADLNPTTWQVSIIGSDGSQAGTNARALVQTFCGV